MLQHNSVFCKCNDFFSPKKKAIKYSLFIFIFHICKKFQTTKKKKKKLVVTCVFEHFQSHCHILKELHEFLYTMGAIIIFGKSSFMFSFVGYGLVTKSFGAGCTFEEMVEKTKCQKMNVNLFTTK
jgi:hypothetical protein